MFLKGTELGLMTPAGVPAVYEPHLAGMGQWESLVSELPDLIKAGGDVASQVYRAVNYSPTVYPTTYAGQYASGGVSLPLGLSPTTLLLAGGAVLLFFMLKR